jgi:hypothetical protein
MPERWQKLAVPAKESLVAVIGGGGSTTWKHVCDAVMISG